MTRAQIAIVRFPSPRVAYYSLAVNGYALENGNYGPATSPDGDQSRREIHPIYDLQPLTREPFGKWVRKACTSGG